MITFGTDDPRNPSVELTLSGVANTLPVAIADAYEASENLILEVAPEVGLLLNDEDPDGDALEAVKITRAAARGTHAEERRFIYVRTIGEFQPGRLLHLPSLRRCQLQRSDYR